ncbi:hypothetical protein [Pelagibius sp. 7325]|uniref:hypothetical protein n=1 Tax=Pelagibius sp. 7325 TaxID=3131994 RepID=UPI0030ED114E
MIHLEKLGFLLLIAIGSLIYAAVRGNPHLRRARELIQTRVWPFIAVLAGCVVTVLSVVAIAIFASADLDFADRSIIRELNTPISVKIPLALLCGALFVELTSVVKKDQTPPLYLAVRAVPFVFFFTIGFFSYELQHVLRAMTRIEAAGITLDFNIASREQPQSLTSVVGNDAGTTNIRTPFQLGVRMLPEAFDRVTRDRDKLLHWCDQHEALKCGELKRIRAALNDLATTESADGDRLALLRVEEQRALEAKDRLHKDFATSVAYLEKLSPLEHCLDRTYVAFFPNGSPIQDELSEFAASYSADLVLFDPKAAKGDPAVDSGHAAPANGPTPVTFEPDENAREPTEDEEDETSFSPALRTLRENLIRFGHYASQYADITKYEELTVAANQCIELRRTLDRDTIRELASLRARLENPTYSLPYKSILEAAIIAASGYPEEAGQHLEREYDLFMTEESQGYFGISRGDFSEFVLAVRLLSPLEGIFGYTRNTDAQVKYARMLVTRVEDQFRKFKAFPADRPSEFVAHCSENGLIRDDALVSAGLHEEIEDYFRFYIYSYLQTYTRLLEAAAFDPGVFTKEERFNHFTRVAQDLGKLSTDTSSALEGCLGPVLRKLTKSESEVARRIEQLRFDTLAAQGFILARQADQREIDPEIAPHIDQTFKEETTCEAQKILLKAWRIRRVAESRDGETPDAAYSERVLKIRRILEQINRSSVECAT